MVIALRVSESAARSRVVLELSDPVDPRVFTLANPNRVVIDMPEVLWRIGDAPHPAGKGLVKDYRYGLFRKGNSRFVIDLNSPVRVAVPQLLPPGGGTGFRLVIDLAPTTSAEFLAHAGWPRAPATAAQAAPTAPGVRKDARPLIVVDAGHGGLDPGTHGESGIPEKDIALSVAKELRKALLETGHYRVQLTRDSDVFIPLSERVNMARAAHGDLFVSLHADSNEHREIRGASVYTLSEGASDREAEDLAEKENMSDATAGADLAGENDLVASILKDLVRRETIDRSERFAETVLETIPAATMVRSSSPHRAARFAVLKAPDVPAALIELGYLSNPKDESEMTTEAWRRRVARAIASAIDRHFAREAGLEMRAAVN